MSRKLINEVTLATLGNANVPRVLIMEAWAQLYKAFTASGYNVPITNTVYTRVEHIVNGNSLKLVMRTYEEVKDEESTTNDYDG